MTGLIGLPPLVGVHALVGNLEGIGKRDRSADFAPTGADRDPHSLMLKLVRPAQRNGEAVDQLITSETVRRRRCDHELVAAEASHDVVGPRCPLEPRPDPTEQIIASAMPVGVIDRLKAIEVQEGEVEAFAGLDTCRHPLLKASPVQKPGKYVELEFMTKLFDISTLLGDIA